jgi:hypothetical protein
MLKGKKKTENQWETEKGFKKEGGKKATERP